VDFKKVKETIEKLEIDNSKTIYKLDNGTELYVHRPKKLGKSLKKEYEIHKNFQIFMKKPHEEDFKPNHLRILINLHLKKISDPAKAEKIFSILEKVYHGEDPLAYRKELEALNFRMSLDSPLVDVCLAQLFMCEQEINYTDGKVKPPRAYLMGYMRLVKCGEVEIDKLLWNSIRHPPPVRFRSEPQKLQQQILNVKI